MSLLVDKQDDDAEDNDACDNGDTEDNAIQDVFLVLCGVKGKVIDLAYFNNADEFLCRVLFEHIKFKIIATSHFKQSGRKGFVLD